MIVLEELEAFHNYKNFSSKLTPKDYLRWGALKPLDLDIAVEARNRVFQSGRIAMTFWLQIAILLRVFSKFLIALVKKLISKESFID